MAWPAGYTVLPVLPADTFGSPYGISRDGSVAVGETWDADSNSHAVYWTESAGPIDIGGLPDGLGAWCNATNDDGSVIVGVAIDSMGAEHAFRWTDSGGVVSLGALAGALNGSRAMGVSADGSVIVGRSDVAGVHHAFRWTAADGMVDLGLLPDGTGATAYGISPDGSVAVGEASDASGTFAVYWPDGGAITALPQLAGSTSAVAYSASADGSVLAGTDTQRAFRWTAADGIADLGFLPGGTYANGYAISGDGGAIIGNAEGAGAHASVYRWTAAGGMVELPDTIPDALGYSGQGLSADGLVIAGGVVFDEAHGPNRGFIYTPAAPDDFPLPEGIIRVLLPPAELQFCDADGNPFAGGTLEFYQLDSSTPKDTWNSPLGGDDHLNTNPLTLDSAGRALIYGDGAYRTVLRDANGTLIWDQPSFTYVSAAMMPVVGAADLATAREAMGITEAIEAEATARAAADSAEATARAAADATLQANIDAEVARAEAAEAALGARIDGLPPPASPGNVQGGEAALDASGYAHVTFPTPFATACDSFVVTGAAVGVWSGAFNVANQSTTGVDVWGSIFGSRTPAAGVAFFWLATGH